MLQPGRDVSSVNGSTNFVDGKNYHFERAFLVGDSIDAQETSKKSHGIYELTETEDINCVVDAYNEYKRQIIDISGGANGNGYKCYVHRP